MSNLRGLIDKKYRYAVIGASRDESKYGHKVLKDLKSAGYLVTPVNLREKNILGLKAYPNLSSIPEIQKPDVVITIVPPAATEKVISEAIELGIDKFWLQPGSESEQAIQLAEDSGAEIVHSACIMVERS